MPFTVFKTNSANVEAPRLLEPVVKAYGTPAVGFVPVIKMKVPATLHGTVPHVTEIVAPVPAAVPVKLDGVPLLGVMIDRHEFGYNDSEPSVPFVIATVIC